MKKLLQTFSIWLFRKTFNLKRNKGGKVNE